MIIKSMSRKVPSFGQLIGYIDRDEGQEAYRIRHNLLSRDPGHIRVEFERNGTLLQRRKNGVYLYHEIISITRAKGISPEAQKERLYEIAQSYIAARCGDNLVFGGLHQDKEHSYHYHLMISANRAGETGRLRLSKAQFRQIQVGLENHVLQNIPELEQKVAIGKRSDRKISRSENELERRSGSRPERDDVLERVRDAFGAAMDRDSLVEALGRNDLELYVRGKNLGVIDHESGKNHRLKTLDAELSDRIEGLMIAGLTTEEKFVPEGEKEKGAGPERSEERGQHQQPERQSAKPDKQPTQTRDSASRSPRGQQEPEQKPSAPEIPSPTQKVWKQEIDAARQGQQDRGRDEPEQGR